MNKVPLCFTDIETTSLDMMTRKAWEIALIRRDTNGEETRVLIVVKDVELSDADPRSLLMNGFYDRHPDYNVKGPTEGVLYLPERDAAKVVEVMVRGAHIVGACPWFDYITLALMLQCHGLVWNADHHLIDVESEMVGYIRGFDDAAAIFRPNEVDLLLDPEGLAVPPWKSHDLSRMLGIESDPATEHTAMGDALWVKSVYDMTFKDEG